MTLGSWWSDTNSWSVIPKLRKPLFRPLPVFECRCCGEIIPSSPKWKEERSKGIKWYWKDESILLTDHKFNFQEELKTAQVSALRECLEELNKKICAQVFLPPYMLSYGSLLPEMKPVPVPELTPKEQQAQEEKGTWIRALRYPGME